MQYKFLAIWLISLCYIDGILAQSIPIQWSHLENMMYSGNNQSVQKSISGNAWNAWARSANELDEGKDGSILFSTNESGIILGLSDFSNSFSSSDVKYGFLFETGFISIIENGQSSLPTNRLNIDHVELKKEYIPNVGWKLKYLINDQLVSTVDLMDEKLNAYVMVNVQGVVVSSTQTSSFISFNANRAACPGNEGMVEAIANGGIAPYSYQWSTGGNSPAVSGLQAGIYTVTVNDNGGNSEVANVQVFSDIIWDEEQDASTTSTSFLSNTNSATAEGYSHNELPQNIGGSIEFKVIGQNGNKSIGFVSPSTAQNGNVEFGFYITNDSYSIGSGIGMITTPFTPGTVFRVLRESNGVFRYYVNGNFVGMSTIVSTSPFLVKATSETLNEGFEEIGVTFCNHETEIASCAHLKRKLDGVRYQCSDDRINFYYDEEYTGDNSTLSYNIYSSLDRINPVLDSNSEIEVLNYGDNRYELNVSSLDSGAYILEVQNQKQEKFFLRFIK